MFKNANASSTSQTTPTSASLIMSLRSNDENNTFIKSFLVFKTLITKKPVDYYNAIRKAFYFCLHFSVLLIFLIIAPMLLLLPSFLVFILDQFLESQKQKELGQKNGKKMIYKIKNYFLNLINNFLLIIKNFLATSNMFLMRIFAGCFHHFFAVNTYVKGLNKDLLSECNILMLNHRSCFDWILILLLIKRDWFSMLPKFRYFLKYEVEKYPFMGPACHILDYCFLKRDFKSDQGIMQRFFEKIVDPWKFTFVVFPEGYVKLPHIMRKCDKFAEANNLKKLKHCTYPKIGSLQKIFRKFKESNNLKINCNNSDNYCDSNNNNNNKNKNENRRDKFKICNATIFYSNDPAIYELDILRKRKFNLYIDLDFIDVTDTLLKNCDDKEKLKEYMYDLWYEKEEKLEFFENNTKSFTNTFEHLKISDGVFFRDITIVFFIIIAHMYFFLSNCRIALSYFLLNIIGFMWMLKFYRKK